MITTTEGPNKGYEWSCCKALSPFLPQLLYYQMKTVWTTLMYLMACTTFGSIEEQFDNREIHTNFFTTYCSWMNGFSILLSFQSRSFISWYAKDITRKLLRNELQIGIENWVRVKAYKCAVRDQDCYLVLYNTQKSSAHVWQSGGYFQSDRSTLFNALRNAKKW